MIEKPQKTVSSSPRSGTKAGTIAIMGKTLNWVREEPSGRLLFRRTYPAALREFMAVPRLELKVPLNARTVMTAEAFGIYDRAKRQFDDDVREAKAAMACAAKAAQGMFDPLSPNVVAFIADQFEHEWHRHDDEAHRARGAEWGSLAKGGWDWLLSDFQEWRAEADTQAMEGYWGKTLDRLLTSQGLRVDPADEAGREGLLWALNDRAVELSDAALARIKGRPVAVPDAPKPPANPRGRARTVSALIDAYTADKWESWGASSRKAVTPAFRVLRETWAARDAASINREDARAIFEMLPKLPRGLGRAAGLRNLSVADAIERAEQKGLPTIGPGTLNNAYLVHMSAMFNWAVREEWTSRNPFTGLKVVDPVSSKDKRDPFSLAQLSALFTLAPWKLPLAENGPMPGRYWVPLLALYSGMRLAEIAGLRIMDLEEIDSIPVLRIRPHAGRGLKNEESRRDVPVHSAIRAIGFLEFVADRRDVAGPEDLLFPDGKSNIRGQGGAKLGEWFSGLLKERGIIGTKLGMHSFRHNFEDRLRAAGLHGRSEGQALAGRKVQGSEGDYGSGFALSHLQAALEQVTYPGLNLSHLKP